MHTKVIILSHYCALVIFMDLFHHWKKLKHSYLWFSIIIGMLHYIFGFPDSSVSKEFTCHTGDPSSIPWWKRSPGEEICYPLQYSWASLVAQLVKNLPAMWETWVGKIPWRRERLPTLNTPVFWPGEFHQLYSPWGHKESYTTECLSHYFSNKVILNSITDGSIKLK